MGAGGSPIELAFAARGWASSSRASNLAGGGGEPRWRLFSLSRRSANPPAWRSRLSPTVRAIMCAPSTSPALPYGVTVAGVSRNPTGADQAWWCPAKAAGAIVRLLMPTARRGRCRSSASCPASKSRCRSAKSARLRVLGFLVDPNGNTQAEVQDKPPAP